jgi:hypothetical protein
MNTYETAADADADRAQQLQLVVALGAWAERRAGIECGAWRISGKTGSIHTAGRRLEDRPCAGQRRLLDGGLT